MKPNLNLTCLVSLTRHDLAYGRPQVRWLSLALLMPLVFAVPCKASGPTLEWIQQIVSTAMDTLTGMSLDGLGNLYLSGYTQGDLGGPFGGASTDGVLARFDIDGQLHWIHQFGGTFQIQTRDVSADSLGNIFLTWVQYNSHGNTGGGPRLGKFDSNANEIWRITDGSLNAVFQGADADGSGNVYVGGLADPPNLTQMGRVIKYNDAGIPVWDTFFGTDTHHERPSNVSADTIGNVFAYGERVRTTGQAHYSALLTKLDSDGNEGWSRILEATAGGQLRPRGHTADGLGNVYITGTANAPIAIPRFQYGYDAFVAKYDIEGNRLWINEFGINELGVQIHDAANDVSVDGHGNVFVVGSTRGDLGGPNQGGSDAFLAMFDTEGNQIWLHQFGTPADDSASRVFADGLGNVYVAGRTDGSLGGPHAGSRDIYVARFSYVIPEPSGITMFLGLALLALRRRMFVG